MWFDPPAGAVDAPPGDAVGVAYAAALFAFPVVLVALDRPRSARQDRCIRLRAGLSCCHDVDPHRAGIVALEEIDSTNAEARRRAEAGEAGPLWITATRQTAGRGRRGRSLGDRRRQPGRDPAHGHRPSAPAEAAQVSFVAALAVADLASACVPPALVRLKWPNDLLIAGTKARRHPRRVRRAAGRRPLARRRRRRQSGQRAGGRRAARHRLRRAHAHPAAGAARRADGAGRAFDRLARRLGRARLSRRSPRPGPSAPMALASPAPPASPARPSKASPRAWIPTARSACACATDGLRRITAGDVFFGAV